MSKTLSTREVEVKGVNRNPKFPKFNSGALKLIDDSWLNVSKRLSIENFREGQKYTVEIETENGFDVIVGIKSTAQTKPAASSSHPAAQPPSDYQAAKDERIKRQGVIQAVVQSPGLHLYASDYSHYKQLVVELATDLLKFVEGGK